MELDHGMAPKVGRTLMCLGEVILERISGDEVIELVFQGFYNSTPEDYSVDSGVDFIRSNPPGHDPTSEDFDRARASFRGFNNTGLPPFIVVPRRPFLETSRK